MHYLPELRKIIPKKKKPKPSRIKINEPLDFYTERSRVSTASSAVVHGEEHAIPLASIGNRFRPRLLGQRVAAAVTVPEELRHWDFSFPGPHAIFAGVVAVAVIVGICGTALIVAWNTEVKKPVCDEACMEYTTHLRKSMDWSVAPCHDFYRFVCGREANQTSVRQRLNHHFVRSVIDHARHLDVPAEGQTVPQRAARFFKTCDDIVTQDTDYVPRIRGYLRDANLHWPEHPETRDPALVDVVSTMLHLSDKWDWPSFLHFSTERLSDDRFEVRAIPTIDLELFKGLLSRLGPGSPLHRTYFETLYTHYGGGVAKGVSFDEMLDFQAQVFDPLLELSFSPPEIYVFERNQSDTSGMWERWTKTIARHYELTGSAVVTISTTHRQYFEMVLRLIAEEEAIVEVVIGWLCVQFTAWFANRQLIANFYGQVDDIVDHHRIVCFAFTMQMMGMAIFVPFAESGYTEPVRVDTWRITRAVRRTVYQTLETATYPWSDLSSAFHLLDIAVAHDIAARYSYYPDMEASFVKNLRDTTQAVRQTDIEAIGVGLPVWALVDELYDIFNYHDHVDYILKPSILTPPMYHINAPTSVRLGTFGVEVAVATVHTYSELRHQGYDTSALDAFHRCFYAAVKDERPEEDGPEWRQQVLKSSIYGAALDVALSVLKEVPSFDEERLHDVPLSGHQLFYVVQCYTHCGEDDGPVVCNEPLRHSEDFANTFSCSAKSNMRSKYQCKTLF